MGTVKKAVYKVDNGVDFDEVHFKTDSEQVICGDGKTAEVKLTEIKNDIIKNNKVKTLLVSRNTNVNGLQVIELGFKPKFIRILAVLAGSNCANYNSDGSYDGNRIVCISKYGNDSVAPIYTSNIVHMHSGGAYNSAVISNVSDTGFALDWSGTQTLPGGIVILMKVEVLGG